MGEKEGVLTRVQVVLLGKLSKAHDDLLAAITELDPETICTVPIMGEWTVKDILGHLVSWNREFRANIAAILAGEHPGYDHQINGEDDFNDSNQAWIAQKRSWSYQRIRADVDRDYEEAVSLARQLKPADFRQRGVTPWKEAAAQRPAELATADTDSVETLMNFHWRHMNMHIRHLQNWRESQG